MKVSQDEIAKYNRVVEMMDLHFLPPPCVGGYGNKRHREKRKANGTRPERRGDKKGIKESGGFSYAVE